MFNHGSTGTAQYSHVRLDGDTPIEHTDLSMDRLEHLVEIAAEQEQLDYKTDLDLNDRRSLLEFAKDVAAFSDKGGWIVVGIDSDYRVAGVERSRLRLWDESTVRPKLAKYLSHGFALFIRVHEMPSGIPGHFEKVPIVLIQVLPHRDGACVLQKDGGANNAQELRKGEIYTRHGSSSELVSGQDLQRILRKRAELTTNAELASQTARAAAYTPLGTKKLETPQNNWLWMRMGWAFSSRPTDLARRVFFSDSFEHRMWSMLESKDLRRDGHHYENRIEKYHNTLQSSGAITHAQEAPTLLEVVVHTQGWISINACEEVSDWDIDDLFGWWIFGACTVAHRICQELGLRGARYTCLRYWEKDALFKPGIAELTVESDVSESTTGYQELKEASLQATLLRKKRGTNTVMKSQKISQDFDPHTEHEARLLPRSMWELPR